MDANTVTYKCNKVPEGKRDMVGRVAFGYVADRLGDPSLVTSQMVMHEIARMVDAGEIG